MSDLIVAWLRNPRVFRYPWNHMKLRNKAADALEAKDAEIERLKAELRDAGMIFGSSTAEWKKEIERLQCQLDERYKLMCDMEAVIKRQRAKINSLKGALNER